MLLRIHYLLTYFSLQFILITTVNSQNVLFVPFGQTQEDVATFVESRTYLEKIESDSIEENMLIAKGEKQVSKYLFHKNYLYSITNEKHYKNKKQAEPIIKAIVDYLNYGEEKVVSIPSGVYKKHLAVMENSRILQLRVKQENRDGEDITIVELSSTSIKYGPEEEIQNYSMLVKNAFTPEN